MITKCNLMNPDTLDNPNAERLDLFKSMSKGKKLTLIKFIIKNIENLSNALQSTRPDISAAFDSLKNGQSHPTKYLENKILSAIFHTNIIQHNSATGKFNRICLQNRTNHDDIKPVIVRTSRHDPIITVIKT